MNNYFSTTPGCSCGFSQYGWCYCNAVTPVTPHPCHCGTCVTPVTPTTPCQCVTPCSCQCCCELWGPTPTGTPNPCCMCPCCVEAREPRPCSIANDSGIIPYAEPGEDDVWMNAPVNTLSVDRRYRHTPTEHGEVCPYLDYKMIAIGWGISPEDIPTTPTGCDTYVEYAKYYIQEELTGFVKPSALQEEFFYDAYGFQKRIQLTQAYEIPYLQVTPTEIEIPIFEENELVNHLNSNGALVKRLYSDKLFATLTEEEEENEDHDRRNVRGCLINKQWRETRDNYLSRICYMKPVEMIRYTERFSLCTACESEEGMKQPVSCDYRDYVQFGSSTNDIFPVCRRYEYYRHTPSNQPVDTHGHIFRIEGTQNGATIDWHKGKMNISMIPFEYQDIEGDE